MIKKLNIEDKKSLLQLLAKDSWNNLQFFEYLPYLENPHSDYQFFGLYENGSMSGAMYVSPLNMGITVLNKDSSAAFYEWLTASSSLYLYGRKDILKQLPPIPNRKPHVYRYGFISRLPQGNAAEHPVRQATLDDYDALIEFYAEKEIMIEMPDRLQSVIENGSAFMISIEGKVVSAALGHSETDSQALMGAVYTDSQAQGQGYARACCEAVLKHFHRKGKIPCLFYDASLTHLERFYQNLGFTYLRDYWILY